MRHRHISVTGRIRELHEVGILAIESDDKRLYVSGFPNRALAGLMIGEEATIIVTIETTGKLTGLPSEDRLATPEEIEKEAKGDADSA